MSFYYEKVVRPILFKLDPEKAHDLGVTALDYLGRIRPLCSLMQAYNMPSRTKPIELFGLQFPTAVGLAAGMDKDGRFWRAAGALGFGHTEIGTVTFHRQPGNERPRLFRFPKEHAIINRMGFNNEGAEAIAARLKETRKNHKSRCPLGINIGKSKVVHLDQAVEDYLKSFNLLVEYADYIAINVSSPNTRDLRKLQSREHLTTLLSTLCDANRNRAKKLGQKHTPILLKIAPDLTFPEIDSILEIIQDKGIDGIIATNTTITRPGKFATVQHTGGLSGHPLRSLALEVVNYISRATHGKLPIIGVGGIDSPESAGKMMDCGAHLVQIYSGMIFRGPFLARDIAKGLAQHHRHWV